MGYIPIIAHPERNKAIVQNLDLLYELINGGALSQLTTSSLLGKFGSKVRSASLKIIDNNLAHFIASDAHSATIRPFAMKQLFKERKLKAYYEEFENYLENGKLMINNERISKQVPTQEYKQKKWFGLFRKMNEGLRVKRFLRNCDFNTNHYRFANCYIFNIFRIFHIRTIF